MLRLPMCAHLTCSRARRQAPGGEAFIFRALHAQILETNAFTLRIPNWNRKGAPGPKTVFLDRIS